MRLDKYVSDAAALTRSESRRAIKNGRVCVNGDIVKDISLHVGEESRVVLDGKEISYKKQKNWI